MCRSEVTGVAQGQLVAGTSGYLTGVVTPWRICYGAATLRALGGLQAITGSFGGKLGYRTAAVSPTRPSSWIDSATIRNTADEFAEDFSLASATDALYIQARWAVAASTGVAEALGTLSMSFDAVTSPLASGRVVVQPDLNTSATAYVPMGGLVSAIGLSGVMAGFRVLGLSGTLGYGLGMRTYKTRSSNPSAWSDVSSVSGITADEYRNTGSVAVSPGTNGFVEFGVKVVGTDVRATIEGIVAGKS